MLNVRTIVYAALIFVAAVLLGTVFFGAKADDETPNATPDAAPVRVATQRIAQTPSTLIATSYSGIIHAQRTSSLGFERSGLVVKVNADLGQKVKTGQVLAQLDTRALQADLLAANAHVLQVEAQRKIAESTLKRQQLLLEKGHISPQRLEEIDANLIAAEAAKAVAQAQVKTLRARLSLSKITAPYDGIIAERYIDEGSIAAPGAPVFSLIENSALEVRIGLPAARAGDVKPGEFYTFSSAGQFFQAQLRGFSGTVDRATQTVSAVFTLPPNNSLTTPDNTLVPGQTARLELQVALKQGGFWVPLSALREDRRGLWSLFALDAEAANTGHFILSPRLVEILYAGAGKVYVRGQIKDGTRIVSGGNHKVTAGMRVLPAEANAARPAEANAARSADARTARP